MDYDKTDMPPSFDAGRGYPPAVLSAWLDVVARHAEGTAIRDILDLGCGTGRFSGGLATRFRANVVAIDPSEKMLSVARSKTEGSVRFERAHAEEIPLGNATVDMVFISMVFHHFVDRAKALSECRRVLRTEGLVCLRAGTREQIGQVPYMAFFPRAREISARVLQSRDEIEAAFWSAGFRRVAQEVIMSQTAASWGEYAYRVSLRADSILTQLSDAEFSDGIARLETRVSRRNAEGPVVEPVDFFVFR